MGVFNNIVTWYAQNKLYFDFTKDVLFGIGVTATIYGYFKFLKFLTQRGTLNKRQEMENDTRTYEEVHKKLKDYVDSYEASLNNQRDIGIRLMYIKNYPYKLENDGFSQMLYYYFMSERHKASGYISTTGIYVMEHLWFFGNSIYYNSKNKKWFIDEKDLSFKKYKELKHKQLVKRIPFANILGYDFNSDWADKGEPVFYTKYKYYRWKLFADDLEAVSVDQEYHLAHRVSLKKSKRTKRTKFLLLRLKRGVMYYFRDRIIRKESKSR
jgi:hypothetical protein